MKRVLLIIGLALAAGTPAGAHRLDEYLQGTLVSVERRRVDVQLTLTPGMAVFPFLMGEMDANADGVLSAIEKKAYAGRVVSDISLGIDGQRLTPHVVSVEFPSAEEMKGGRGEIRIEFDAELPPGSFHRRFTLDNRHESRIAAYQVNCLISRDPLLQIVRQNRSYTQSHYELEFTQEAAEAGSIGLSSVSGVPGMLGILAMLLFSRFIFLSRRRI